MADDTSPDPADPARLLALTAQIVSAHVGGNKVAAAELPRLIAAVRGALEALGQRPVEAEPPRPEPAVPVRRSMRPDAIACLECGAWFKMLRRHLAVDHGLTPEEYRARWELRGDYPMVAPDYAAARSGMAKRIGLGRRRAPEAAAAEDGVEEQEAAPVIPEPEPEPTSAEAPNPDGDAAPAPKRRGRRKTAVPPDAG